MIQKIQPRVEKHFLLKLNNDINNTFIPKKDVINASSKITQFRNQMI